MLGRDFQIVDFAARFRDGKAVGAHSLYMKFNCFLKFALGFLDRVADRHAPRKIRNVRRVVPFAFSITIA